MIRRGSSRQARHFMNLPGLPFWWFSEHFLGDFPGEVSRPFSWGFDGGYMHEPFVVLFPWIPLPNPWEKGLNFRVFVVLGFGVFLAEIFWFLLIQRVLVDNNLAMECPWGVSTIPKVLFGSVERIRRAGVGFGGVDPRLLFIPRLGVGFGGVDPRVLFIPCCPRYTGLIGVSPLWDLPRLSCWIRVSLGCFSAGHFLAVLDVFWLALCWFFFRACCVLRVFLFQGLEKSLRLSGTFVVLLL
jgi:hypothetical protein